MVKLIAFTGKIGSGKTTASECVNYTHHFTFASPLKEASRELFGFTTEQLYDKDEKEQIDSYWGVSPREVLQWLGTDCLREKFPGFFIKRMEQRFIGLDDNSVVVISDVRFDDEARFVRDNGGVVVQITRTNGNQHVDAELAGHLSEKGISPNLVDVVVENNGTLEDFIQKIKLNTIV
jgi:hypothetical protein